MALSMKARLLLLSLCLAIAPMVFAADDEPKYTLNMQDLEITELIDLVSKVTGETFIIDPRVRGKVTVISDQLMTKSQIFETFLATLEVYGFSAVDTGDVIKIIGQSDIRSAGINVETRGGREGEEVITRVFPVQNVSAMELVPILRPMVAKYGHVSGVPSANVLIVVDRATNLQRISEVLELLDKAGNEDIEVINLEHAWVGGMITLLERIAPATVSQGGSSSSNRGVSLVGDERSNRILVKGEREARAEIIALIKQLDTPSEDNASFKVIFLNNADAKKMAEILKGFTSGSGANSQDAPPAQPVSIIADEEQNALIVRAEPNELSEIESIISQLDIPREQVLIEAAIVEVTGDVGDALGVQWASNPEQFDNGVPLVTTNNATEGQVGVGSAIAAIAGGQEAAAGVSVPGGLLVGLADPFNSPANFGVIIQALEKQSNTNLLSTPSVMTLDNSEAFITVGETVPFPKGRDTEQNPFTAIEREDVGTTLTVIPHVQQDGTVRLEVDQVVESVKGASDFGSTTSKRQVKTEVLVKNGETIVIGGLISDSVTETEQRVPVLGKLPIIGALFKAKSTTKLKTNLLIILRPTIVTVNSELRDKRLNGIWELRIQSLDGDKGLVQPSVDDIFDGNYINGATPVAVE